MPLNSSGSPLFAKIKTISKYRNTYIYLMSIGRQSLKIQMDYSILMITYQCINMYGTIHQNEKD